MKEKKEEIKKISEKKDSVPEKRPRILKGVVSSDKMDKTVTVLVDRYKKHFKYKKRYKVSKRYKAHDEKNEYKEGDKIFIKECKPLSKDKQWEVVEKIN